MKKLLRMALFAALPLAAMMMFSSYSGSSSDNLCPPGDDLGPTRLYPGPDCSSFYACSNGVPILMHCPDGLHFNSKLGVCEWPRDAGCIDNSPISMYPCHTDCSGEYNPEIKYNVCPNGENMGNIYGQCSEVTHFAPSETSSSHHCYRHINR